MSRLIVIEFVSLDGVMHDPDGSDGSPRGGWAFRYGPQATAGDKFGLGEVLDTGVMLLGRRTWQLFAKIWPGRDDPFSAKMNAMPKLVVSRARWRMPPDGGTPRCCPVTWRPRCASAAGSGTSWSSEAASVVRALAASNLVDEYRLLVFPVVLGEGDRVFPDGTAPASLALVSAEARGPAARLVYTRQGDQ